MPQERSDMRRVKEVLRLAHELGYSLRQTSRSVRLCSTSVRNYLARAEAAGVRYEDIASKSEAEIEALDKKPIPVIGDLAVFGEDKILRRPPYLVIGLLTQPSRKAASVELLNAYAHPCVAWDRLTLVDSNLERETLALLISCRDWLAKNHNVTFAIQKPHFDVGPDETENAREVCIPDFILRPQGHGIQHRLVVVAP